MWDEIASVLRGRLVTLEPLTHEHVDGLRRAAADERIWRLMVTTDVERWLADAVAEHDAGRRVQFVALREGEAVRPSGDPSLGPRDPRRRVRDKRGEAATGGSG